MILEEISRLKPMMVSLAEEEKPIFLYGMGNGAEKIYAYLCENGIKIQGVVASDGFVRGQTFLGHTVISISDAERTFGRLCLVTCFGLEGEKSRFLYDIAKRHRIVSPNLPVFGDGVCDKSYILDNIDRFERLYSILEDDKSKEVLLSILKYNITGNIDYLRVEAGFDAPDSFYNHSNRHIDVGAYDGDTAIEFANKSDTYSDIVAFEPDENTYKKLIKNTQHIRSITPINAAVGKDDRLISFASGGGRASHCGEGGAAIDCVSIDKYCGYTHIHAHGTPVGSIKIDAEGMDEDVICGAVNTIYCCKCNLSVALYHRAHDIIDLPLLIRNHNSKYKFYLRKKEYIPAWDIFLYAINT